MTENTENTIINRTAYSETKGTGVLSTIIFAIVVTIIMVIIAYFKG
ncbi:MAG: hypothetical protein K2F57_02015 [Candidatus Gastranaerophilales bacterium]|nr:hypothetical protein [Candidatus Gastranaerophilales bacterium]